MNPRCKCKNIHLCIFLPSPFNESEGRLTETKLSKVLGRNAEHVYRRISVKDDPLHAEDYVFIWDYRW